MRTPYLVVTDNEKSSVYTDGRKVKKMFVENKDIKVYIFKIIDKYKHWEGVYEICKDGQEIEVKMYEDSEYTYTTTGCNIMEWLAKAEWNSSIKYPSNGWYICSVCGDITNEIDKCCHCGEFVCWNCSHEVVNNEWDEGHYCSYTCYRLYLAECCGTEYNPEKEHKESICNRVDRILEYFEKEQLLKILIHIESMNYDYDIEEQNEIKLEYENKTKEELLNEIYNESEDDIHDALMELYENETEEHLDSILDGEAFINNLDPNDPADEWFFED